MEFYTSTLWSDHNNKVDITIKSNKTIFAPTWNMVTNLKKGVISEETYTRMYYDLMRNRYTVNKEGFLKYINSEEEYCFTCFCPKDKFCHRLLLADILQKLGATYLGEYK